MIYDQSMLKDNPVRTVAKEGEKKGEKLKGKVTIDQEDLSQKHTTQVGSKDEKVEEELDAYIEEGENAGGDFPINKVVVLRQDVLANHLAELLVSNLMVVFH